MRINDYLTDDTSLISAYKKNECIAVYPGREEIFYKAFDINEFICERIGIIQNLNVNHYFLLSLSDSYGEIKYSTIKNNKNNNIKLGSYNFCTDKNKIYMPSSTGMDLYDVLEWPTTDSNREELANEILKLFAFDIYTWQTDRDYYNIKFEIDSKREFHLSTIYDFEESLDVSCLYDGIFVYDNALYKFQDLDDYFKIMDEFPIFKDYLKSYQDIDLCKEIKIMFDERNLDISKFPLDRYKRFEEESQKMLCKILK